MGPGSIPGVTIVRTVPHKVIDMPHVVSEPELYNICGFADPKADEYTSLRKKA